MKPRRLSCLITACIVCFMCSAAVYAQPHCKTGADLTLSTAWLHVPPHPEGFWNLRFATVSYTAVNNPSQPMRAVIEDAIREWNTLACYTGILFLTNNTGTFSDIDFVQVPLDSEALGCAAYRPIFNGLQAYDIYYGPAFLGRLSNPALGHNEARAVMMHELGHVLGLDHTNPPVWTPTIMTQLTTCLSPMAVTSLSTADAQKVGQCLNSSPACFSFSFPPIAVFVCVQQGNHWNFTLGGCFEEPQPAPCEECMSNDDCCYGDVCHNGQCGPPELFCPPCPPDTVCYEGMCSYCTPILIDVDGDGFQLTDVAGGVDFDFEGDGVPRRMSWTAVGADDAWLVLDRNRNGRIDNAREMFGNLSPQPRVHQEDRNGFIALAEFDKSNLGGNGDGVISRQDYIFRDLQLWNDSNHNGVSETAELSSLEPSGLAVLELKYEESRRRDQYGNWFRYRAKVKDARDTQIGRRAWDVILRTGN